MTNFVSTTEDVIAPEPVRDLILLTAVEGTGVLTVGWTAPGDDPGQGIGTYTSFFSFSYIENNVVSFCFLGLFGDRY